MRLLTNRLATLIIVGCVTIALALTACYARPAFTDGSLWKDGVMVGTYDRDAMGNVINRKGDTAGIVDDPSLASKTNVQVAQDGLRNAAKTIGWIAGILCLGSAVGIVASFWVPWLPRSLAIKGFLVSMALMIVQYWVNRFGEAFAVTSFWIALVAGIGGLVAFGCPWIKTFYNANKQRAALQHLESDPAKAHDMLAQARPDDKPGEIAAFVNKVKGVA